VGDETGPATESQYRQSVMPFDSLPNRQANSCSPSHPCRGCVREQAFLRSKRRSRRRRTGGLVTAVDLFAGCGGMTVGLDEAVRRLGCELSVSLAVDFDPASIEIYQKNFPTAATQVGDVSSLFDGAVGDALTASERKVVERVGDVDILLGGPPCQGHSDLNNHTRRRDPKNALYSRMARAAEVLHPKAVIIENVTPVQWDEGGVVEQTSQSLTSAGYKVAGRVLDLRRLGVPQRRKRFVLVAVRIDRLDPREVLNQAADCMPDHPDRTVRWAIGDLLAKHADTVYDTASKPTAENAKRIQLLFDNELYDLPDNHRPKCHRDKNHSYVSMYGRLRWGRPAQTITTGFGSMGQGRYVHPQRPRTLTPHEAARLQTFPDWFDFGEKTKRGVLATVIGNAVPPLLMIEIGKMIIPGILAENEAHEEVRRRA
jgi:DNA (cytosine-5)-methyltransferase 1